MLPELEAVATDEPRALKVRIPAALHVKLYALRILTGISLSDAVTQALHDHFRNRPHQAG